MQVPAAPQKRTKVSLFSLWLVAKKIGEKEIKDKKMGEQLCLAIVWMREENREEIKEKIDFMGPT